MLKGSAGTISSYDYDSTIRVQTEKHPEGRDVPAGKLQAPYDNPISYFLHCIETGEKITGPLSPAISRIGQQIVDSADLAGHWVLLWWYPKAATPG